MELKKLRIPDVLFQDARSNPGDSSPKSKILNQPIFLRNRPQKYKKIRISWQHPSNSTKYLISIIIHIANPYPSGGSREKNFQEGVSIQPLWDLEWNITLESNIAKVLNLWSYPFINNEEIAVFSKNPVSLLRNI